MSENSECESGAGAMDVSIIIVAWNVRQLVYDCLKSVYDETKGIQFEVLYVDNASEDGSVEMVRKEFPDVRIIENQKNEGFIRANNQAIEISRGRYVLLLNSDTLVLDNAITKTVKFADEHPEAAVIGCKVFYPDRSLQRDCFMYPSLLNMLISATYLNKIFPKSTFFGRERMTWWDFNDVREVQTICGCYSLVRMEAIKQVGVMDEAYYVYGDDPDWCYRFNKAGWKNMFMPHAQIIHYGGQTTSHRPEKFKLQLFGSILIFMRLHRSRLEFVLACILVALTLFIRIPYWILKALINKRERNQALKTVKTYGKGGFYCLTDWKKLLMNRDVLNKRLRNHVVRAGI
ncbi:MAG: glycosyltransferase family 2 protein [Sedimentisphaerales bacterium]|nr:glycosyltransferase family 2 protein [Sedimentisphaerales bacterium]